MFGGRLRPEVGNSRTRPKSGSGSAVTIEESLKIVRDAMDKTTALSNQLQSVLDADKGKTMQEFSDAAIEGEKKPEPMPELPVDPFFLKAQYEAHDDSLLGITRSPEWIAKRAKELADEDFDKPIGDPTRIGQDYYRLEMITDMMSAGAENALPPHVQGRFDTWMADHLKQAIDKFCETYKPEDLYRKQLEEDNAIVLKAERNKISKDQQDAARMTLTFIKSSLFCLMIPVASFLPDPWNLLQAVIVGYVFWMNYPALSKLRKVMKQIKEREEREAKEKRGETNYDPAV